MSTAQLVPMVVEQSSRGERAFDLYSRLLDVMQHVRPEVSTWCVGMAMSAAAVLLAAGSPGRRRALPNSKVIIHQGSAGSRGAPSDMEIQLREVLALANRMTEILAFHTRQPADRVRADMDRDYYLTATEARDYGLVDEVVTLRRGLNTAAPTCGQVGPQAVAGVTRPDS